MGLFTTTTPETQWQETYYSDPPMMIEMETHGQPFTEKYYITWRLRAQGSTSAEIIAKLEEAHALMLTKFGLPGEQRR